MGILLMCLTPALYCNVTDAWTLADKWKRIIISFAGIYVELVIAAIATFVWWYTPQYPVVNNIALCVMVLCSVSTVVFNANPLMRFDGYYILADWLEIPNLREKANRFLNNLFLSKCLGVEVPPEPYMAPWRKWLFVIYAIASWVYRWVIMFSILWFLADFLGPEAEDPEPDAGDRVAGVDVRLADVQGHQEHPPTGAVAGHESRAGLHHAGGVRRPDRGVLPRCRCRSAGSTRPGWS